MTSPTKRTLDELRKLGFTAQVVERFCSFSKRRIDLLNCIDIVACKPGVGVLGIQATSGTNHSHRMVKVKAEPKLRAWLESGGRFEIFSWAKRGAAGERKTWQLRREEVLLDQLDAA